MKHIKRFFQSNKLTKEDIDQIEDIFTSYMEDESLNNNHVRFPFKKVKDYISVPRDEDRPYIFKMINFYYFSNLSAGIPPFTTPTENKNLKIFLWASMMDTISPIIDKFTKRVEKFGFKVKLNMGGAASAETEGFYGKKNTFLKSEFKLSEYIITVTKS